MHKVSIEQALRWLQRFLSAEWRLALPLALAFLALPPLLTSFLIPPQLRALPQTVEQVQAISALVPWWLLPAIFALILVTTVGGLALVALALVPRISVSEAIGRALRRLPVWLAAGMLLSFGLFALLILCAVLLSMVRLGQLFLLALTMIAIIVGGLFMTLLMPLVIARPIGPIAALREGFRLYRGVFLRLAGGLLLFLLGAWIVALAAQVALGSIVMLVARACGQAEIGRVLLALLAALVSAIEWGAFYLLAANLYRQRSGHAPAP